MKQHLSLMNGNIALLYIFFLHPPHRKNLISNAKVFFLSSNTCSKHSNEHNQFDMITRRYKTKEVLFRSKIQNILASELIHCIKRFHIRSCNFEIMKLTLQKLFKKFNKFAVKCTLSCSPKTKWSKKWEHTQFSI